MKTLGEFKEFYRKELKDTVRNLQKDAEKIYSSDGIDSGLNSQVDKFRLALFVFGFLLICYPFVEVIWDFNLSSVFLLGVIPFLVGLGYSMIKKFGLPLKNREEKNIVFKKRIKDKLIKKIVHFFGQNFSYKPTVNIKSEKVNESFILPREANGAHGEDYVKGRVGKTEVEFSEIILSESNSANHYRPFFNGRRQPTRKFMDQLYSELFSEDYHSFFFRGIYLSADFPKEFRALTLVRPTEFEWPDSRMEEEYEYKEYQPDERIDDLPHLSQVHLEDQEFESAYNVYSTDQQQARYILSTSLMERIRGFTDRTNKQLFFCFRNSKMHLAIPHEENLLEPNIEDNQFFKNTDPKIVLDKGRVFTFFRELQFILGIVEDFNLNTRIWSKQ